MGSGWGGSGGRLGEGGVSTQRASASHSVDRLLDGHFGEIPRRIVQARAGSVTPSFEDAGSEIGLRNRSPGPCLPEEVLADKVGARKRYGAGIASCLQIARAVPAGMSRWRGTGARRSRVGLCQMLCLAPSRRRLQPWPAR